MAAIKKITALALSLLLLFSSIPGEAIAAAAGCTLDWKSYNLCLKSTDLDKYPSLKAAFEKCNIALKADNGYTKTKTAYPMSSESQRLSYAYFYSEGKSSIPAKYTAQADRNSYQHYYAAAMLKNKDSAYTMPQRQAFAKYWAAAEVQKKKDYAAKQQEYSSGSVSSLKYDQPVTLASDNTRVDNTGTRIKVQQFQDQVNSDQLAANNLIKANKANADAAKYKNSATKTEADLVPVAIIADPGTHTEYSVVPVTTMSNGTVKPKTDMKGNQVYATIPLVAPNTPLVFDQVRITYTGKPAVASMKAIARDLLDFKSKTKPPTKAGIAKAGLILLAMLKTDYDVEALNKLGFIAAMLLSTGEKSVSMLIVKSLAGIFASSKDYYLRMKAAMALGIVGSVSPMREPLADNIILLLSAKASNDTKTPATIGGASFTATKMAGGLGDDFQVRVAALVALAAIGTWDAIVSLGSVPKDSSLFAGEACEDDNCDYYYRCDPQYNKEPYNASKDKEVTQQDEAANDGAIQCMTPQVLKGFFEGDRGATSAQKGYALTELKELAREDICGSTTLSKKWPYLPIIRPLSNASIHATLALSSMHMIADKCLEPIAQHVSVWEGNEMKIPCGIVDSVRTKLKKEPTCESDMLWHEAITIVGQIIKGILIGLTVKVGIGAVTANLANAAKSCYYLAKGIEAVEVGEKGFSVYEKVVMGKELKELTLVMAELSSGEKH